MLSGAVALGAAGCAVGQPGAGSQPGRGLGRDDRTLITNFSELMALTTGPRHVFGASPVGIVAYDFAFGRWELPITEGFPTTDRVSALAYDPSGMLLWLGTANGSLYSYSLAIDRWDRVTTVGISPIVEIVPFARQGALFIATQGGWLRLAFGSFIAEPIQRADVPPMVLQAVANAQSRQDSFLDAARGTLALDAALRRWRALDIVPAERPGEYWIATFGGGLLRYDTRFSRSEWLPYGLLSRGSGGLAVDGDRIWFGGDGGGLRDGVASADRELQRWTQFEAGYEAAPRGAVMDILPARDAIWFAATDGLYRLARGAAERPADRLGWRRLTAADGLPTDGATSLAAAGEGLWVGTPRGLIRIAEDGQPQSAILLAGVRINRLTTGRDTLWVATDEGLYVVAPAAAALADAEPNLEPAPFATGSPVLRGRVMDVATTSAAVFAVMEDAYFQLERGAWSPPQRGPALARLSRLGRITADDDGIWLAGELGVARLDLAGGRWTFFTAPGDIPAGPIRDVLPAGEYVWVSTPAGAFRFRWQR